MNEGLLSALALVLWSLLILVVAAWIYLYITKKKKAGNKKYPYLENLAKIKNRGVIQFYFELPNEEQIIFYLLDEKGNKTIILEEKRKAKSHVIEFDTTKLENGTYYYCMQSEGFSNQKKIIIDNV